MTGGGRFVNAFRQLGCTGPAPTLRLQSFYVVITTPETGGTHWPRPLERVKPHCNRGRSRSRGDGFPGKSRDRKNTMDNTEAGPSRAPTPSEAPRPAPPELPAVKILIVDDDKAICEYMQTLLERDGFHVKTLTDPTGVEDE